MKYCTLLACFGLFCSLASAQEEKTAHFLFDLRPGSFLISPDLDGFQVSNTSGSITRREKIEGVGTWSPSLNLGLGLDFGNTNLNITAGPGYLINGGFHGAFWQADLGLLFELANGHFRIGPHIGVIGLGDATWENWSDSSSTGPTDSDIDLKGNTGFKGGLTLHAGGKKVAFLANIDYVNTSYDVTTRNGWVATDSSGKTATEIDMTGVAIDLGVIFRF